ncbi:MAG: hypothetical protein NT070_20675 [Cyanobacteria bacterium]|nr:hypothetical protein [Cyanobacteriota bacterium]
MSLPPADDVFSEGFSAGIQVWLVFLLAFYILRYPAPLSIMLGAIAGVSAGFIVGWWSAKPNAVVEEIVEENSLEEVAQIRFRKRRNYARMRNSRNKPEVKWDWNMVKDNLVFWRR